MEKVKQKAKQKARKLPVFVWLILAAFLAEAAVCNFSSWASLFYGDEISFESTVSQGMLMEDGTFGAQEGNVTVKLQPALQNLPEQHMIGQTVHDLYFDVELSQGEVLPYTVTLTDEGNAYPYTLPENQIAVGVERSYYTKLYPAGSVEELWVQFYVPEGSTLRINGISANVPIPGMFHIGRFLVICLVFLLFYCVRRPGGMQEELCFTKEKRGRIQLVITAAVILLLMGMAWKLAHVNPVCVTSPWPHHKQYQELAQSMAEGRLYLDAEPSEGLKTAPNPYDTIYLQANGIDYQADYAYHDGKYFVYFGVVPELLLYLPCYLLTGHALPNYLAVFFFFCGFILAVFALYREVVKRWFPQTPFPVYLLLCGLTVCCGNYLFVMARPDLYDTPIMAVTMFTAAGFFFWLRGKYASSPGERKVCFFFGSLCMALVAGCRPQMLLFSFAAIPMFWNEVVKVRKLFTRRSVWDTACICAPYIFVAAGIMYYNGARFGSPFDFGATYSLTSNDMTNRSFNLEQMFLGLWHYFLQPPVIGSDFPFLNGSQIASASYMGKLNAEYTYGGILACNVFSWIIICMGKTKTELKKKGIYGLLLVNLLVPLALGVVDVTGAGILQRYLVDALWGIVFASALLWLAFAEKLRGTKQYRLFVTLLAAVCLFQAAYAFGVVFGNGDLSVNVRTSNPQLYYQMKDLFRF